MAACLPRNTRIEEQRVKDTDRLPDGTTLDSAVQLAVAGRQVESAARVRGSLGRVD